MEMYGLCELQQKLQERNQKNGSTKVLADNEIALFDDISQIPIQNDLMRLDMAVFGLCLSGECCIKIGDQEYVFTQNKYLVILPGQVVRIVHHSEDFRPILICCDRKVLAEVTQFQRIILPLLLYIRHQPCEELDASDIAWLTKYYQLIFNEMCETNNIFQKATTRGLLQAMIAKICNLYAREVSLHNTGGNGRQEEVFTNFIRELSIGYKQHRDLQYYADRLCLTAKYLSAIVKQVSGLSATQWIECCVVEETKVLLQTTSLTIQQIADELNFPNQSFFGKYIKKHTGLSPKELRKQMQA